MFIYQNAKKEICITFKDNKPVEFPEYVIKFEDDKLIVNDSVVTSLKSLILSEDKIFETTGEVIESPTVIDLNGYTMSIPEDTEGNGVFQVNAGGKLTITGEGTINGVGKNDYNMAIWANGGDVVINGGIITNTGARNTDGTREDHYDLIYAKGSSTVEINGGTFIAETPKWTLNKKDNDPCKFIVKGGRFYQFDPSNTETEPASANNNFVADGYTVIQDGDWFEVVKA